MTVKKAILLAKKTIIEDIEYLLQIKQSEAKNSPDNKILARIDNLLKTIVFNEICLCTLIIRELESKNDSKRKKKSL